MTRSKVSTSTTLVLGIGLLAALASSGLTDVHDAAAQAPEVAWYRIVNEGRSAGTMTTWHRVGEGAAATFPFMDDFEVNIRPEGPLVVATIQDGRSRVSTAIGCSGDHPRRAMLRATRTGASEPVVMVAMQCSATEPTVH